MRNLIYILLVIVFFNSSVLGLSYLGVLNNYYNNVIDIVIINIVVFVILGIYSVIYKNYLINKFNYFKIMFLGMIIGFIISLIIYELSIEEYIFIILFTSFSFTFISYSIYFDSIKDNVFS